MTSRAITCLWERVRTKPFWGALVSVTVLDPQSQGCISPSESVELVLFVNIKDQW